ncbi:hypothetical protein EDB80DRAFT_871855 [Ilyonectria destructans]|nr:hypothetical protein EDB80DRAFT_871855 [Ilyonectria destructans]
MATATMTAAPATESYKLELLSPYGPVFRDVLKTTPRDCDSSEDERRKKANSSIPGARNTLWQPTLGHRWLSLSGQIDSPGRLRILFDHVPVLQRFTLAEPRAEIQGLSSLSELAQITYCLQCDHPPSARRRGEGWLKAEG